MIAAVVCYLLAIGGVTLWRNEDFNHPVRLWSAEVVENPRDYLGWQSLADSLFTQGEIEDADQAQRYMLEFAPDYPGGWRSRATFFLLQKRYVEALEPATKVFAMAQAKGNEMDIAFDALVLAEIHIGLGECELALRYLEGPAHLLQGHPRTSRLKAAAYQCQTGE